MEKITSFTDEYFFLNNSYPTPVTYGLTFGNSEAAYQAAKCPERREEFHHLGPAQATELGRKVTLRHDWDEVKRLTMYHVCKAKFQQNVNILAQLLATGDAELVNENVYGDTFWGVCDGVGRNELGKILMELREKLRVWKNTQGAVDYLVCCTDGQDVQFDTAVATVIAALRAQEPKGHDAVDVYYGYQNYEDAGEGVFHAIVLKDPAEMVNTDEIAKDLAEALDTTIHDDRFNWDRMRCDLPWPKAKDDKKPKEPLSLEQLIQMDGKPVIHRDENGKERCYVVYAEGPWVCIGDVGGSITLYRDGKLVNPIGEQLYPYTE